MCCSDIPQVFFFLLTRSYFKSFGPLMHPVLNSVNLSFLTTLLILLRLLLDRDAATETAEFCRQRGNIFANILVFTRLWRFLNTHRNVYLMIPVSVSSFTLRFLCLQSNTEECSAALVSDRLTGKVLKLVLSAKEHPKTLPAPQKTGGGGEGWKETL